MQINDLPSSGNTGESSATRDLIALADRCVQCGLCLPQCPTYVKTLSEADSPRGRIALIRAVAEGRLTVNQRYEEHIDLCLSCGACEAACPNQVSFGALLNQARSQKESLGRRTLSQRLFRRLAFGLLSHPVWMSRFTSILRVYQLSGLQRLVRRSGLLRQLGVDQLDAQLPHLPRGRIWREHYPAVGTPRGDVGIFLGCVARSVDTATLSAAIYVLNRLGYGVRVPREQGCCGALHRHAGEIASANDMENANVRAFSKLALVAVVGTASGCAADSNANRNEASALASFTDISRFLADADGWNAIEIAPLKKTIVVHDPCTLRNKLSGQVHPYRLLERIPGITIESLSGNEMCCGAAGSYFLTQPEMSRSLLQDKIAALRSSAATVLCTSNIGCALHLAAGMRGAGMTLEVLHPITVLARQMGFRDGQINR
ncbi:MAG: (Fe-S)-binding protein [Burkholderiales bacterium]|nr:(Fe-S)-binding protein [Burkholderiales bacterium]